jgi:organic radical activating enzyme
LFKRKVQLSPNSPAPNTTRRTSRLNCRNTKIEVARDLRTLGCQEIHVTGGEPLLCPDWDDLCSQFVAFGFKVGLITNGTLFDEPARTRARPSTGRWRP